MPTYYEVLKLDATASVEVIEVAIDERYNQYRRLVNHHDPNVVEQANRALRQLEEIRTTLTNPERRTVYDQTISFGGLADPTAILQAPNSNLVSAPPSQPKVNTDDAADVNAWKCKQCGKANRIGSKTCSNCGTILARNCPGFCGNVVLLSEKYCSNCGMSVEEGLAKLQVEFEQAQKQFLDELRTNLQLKRTEIDRLNSFSSNFQSFWGLGRVPVLKELSILLDQDMRAVYRSSLNANTVIREMIAKAIAQRQEYLRHAERRLQEEQSRTFDPLSPKRYFPTAN